TLRGRAFDGIVSRHAGTALLELEPLTAPRDDGAAIHRALNQAVVRMRAAPDVLSLCQVAATEVRRLTGFDRAFIYRFDAEGNGEVLAEAKEPGLDSYVGLHYPASDIPKQARELYKLNTTRVIADRSALPVPLQPETNPDTGAPLDMSLSVLRAVSPVHLEYMRNLGVEASMSISLLQEEKLWGLLSCNHREARRVPCALRSACELLGRILSLELRAREEREAAWARARLPKVQRQLAQALRQGDDVLSGLVKSTPSLLDLIPSTGAAVYLDGRLETVGRTPPPEQLHALARWLWETSPGQLYHTTSLPRAYPPAEAFKDVGCGLLAFSLPKPTPHYVLWFRPEMVETVSWAGDPRKSVEVENGGPRLHPRRSFELWREAVRLTAPKWTSVEVEAACDLRQHAMEVDLGRQVRREQAARADAEAEHRRFAFLADASALLSNTLDYDKTLASMAELATAQFCDLCVIDLLRPDGTFERVQARHADPARQPLADRLRQFPPGPTEARRPSSIATARRAVLQARVDEATARAVALDEAHFDLVWRQLELRSLVAVPLVARDRSLGAIVFASTSPSGREFTEQDLRLAEELGRRAAMAIDNALLFQEAQRAVGETRKAVQAREDLVAVVSHDLRNPLNVIQLQTALIRKILLGQGPDSAPRVKQATDRIQRSLEKMNSLIQDLLDLAKIEVGRFAVETRPEPVGRLVDEAFELLKPLADQKGVTLSREVAREGLSVHA
ncbi:MAG TPA: GAF domain-containing protein, partial [Longimicrobium sp.]|nr:GAF domain-containing protein [Longimicrobium sp.]